MHKAKCKQTDFAILSCQQRWSKRKELNLSFVMEKDGIKASSVTTETSQTELSDLATGKYTSAVENESCISLILCCM